METLTTAPWIGSTRPPTAQPFRQMVWIPGGTFRMGSNNHYPEEAPVHFQSVAGFWMDQHPVTNREFRQFVEASGYITVSERIPTIEQYPDALPEMLVAGSVVFQSPDAPVAMSNHYNWWNWIPGADWQHPQGPDSDIRGKDRHPVVHIADEDARAYTEWAGKQLPTEAEWEFAARGGLDGAEYAWGDEFTPKGKHQANTWQGNFPFQNTEEDGFIGTSPVGSYRPNQYELVDMIGNVWEWTTDWYTDSHAQPVGGCCSAEIRADTQAAGTNPNSAAGQIPRKVIKGGSHLCAPNYCQRYRPAARMHHPIDTGTSHLGFRCIVRPQGG